MGWDAQLSVLRMTASVMAVLKTSVSIRYGKR
jgi:hypothetical protein